MIYPLGTPGKVELVGSLRTSPLEKVIGALTNELLKVDKHCKVGGRLRVLEGSLA